MTPMYSVVQLEDNQLFPFTLKEKCDSNSLNQDAGNYLLLLLHQFESKSLH